MRLSRIIMLPFALVGGYVLYQLLVFDQYQYSWYLIPPVIAIAACLALYPQLDAIGYKWWPPKADPKLRNIFVASSPSAKWLKPEDHDPFFSTALNEIRKLDFIGMKVDDIPTDVKVMSIYPALIIRHIFGIDLLKVYNRVVFYKHPFPSPQYQKWHSAEINHEDGVLLFSLEQLIPNFSRSEEFYHIGFDVWIRAFLKVAPDFIKKSEMDVKVDWESDDLVLSRAQQYLGLDIVLNRHINWQAFFQYPERFQQKLPQQYSELTAKINLSSP